MRVGDKPLRRQRRPVQIAPRQTRRPRCTARRQHPPAPAQDQRPARRPACSRSDGQSATLQAADRSSQLSVSRRPNVLRSGRTALIQCNLRNACDADRASSAGRASPRQITDRKFDSGSCPRRKLDQQRRSSDGTQVSSSRRAARSARQSMRRSRCASRRQHERGAARSTARSDLRNRGVEAER